LTEDAFWLDYFGKIKILNFDFNSAKLAGAIYRALKGNQVDMPDLLIVAIALNYKLPLATLNKKHFQRIPDLQLVEI
jgi:tRNA(fMet)-specific endonuclease VapC